MIESIGFSFLTPFTLADFTLDGVFGMGRQDTSSDSFLSRAVSSGAIASTTWSYQPSNGTAAGSMLLGGYDETQISGSIAWVPSPEAQYYWNSTMTNMAIGGTVLWD